MISAIVDVAHALATIRLANGDHRGAIEAAATGLTVDPWSEQLLDDCEAAAEAAGNAALLARQRYSSGLVDFQVVLETQRTQLNTQDSVASARADLSADYVRLYKALGGGWNPDGSDAAAAPTANTTRDPRS